MPLTYLNGVNIHSNTFKQCISHSSSLTHCLYLYVAHVEVEKSPERGMVIYLLQVTFVIRSENEGRNEVYEIVY